MRRIDFLQRHRPGVLALLRHLPADPPMALALAAASLCSMGWMLEGGGHFRARACAGELRAQGAAGGLAVDAARLAARRQRGSVGDDGGAGPALLARRDGRGLAGRPPARPDRTAIGAAGAGRRRRRKHGPSRPSETRLRGICAARAVV